MSVPSIRVSPTGRSTEDLLISVTNDGQYVHTTVQLVFPNNSQGTGYRIVAELQRLGSNGWSTIGTRTGLQIAPDWTVFNARTHMSFSNIGYHSSQCRVRLTVINLVYIDGTLNYSSSWSRQTNQYSHSWIR